MSETASWEDVYEIIGEITLGESLRNYREIANMTQKELSTKIGHSASYISDIENMRRKIPFSVVLKYAKATKNSEKHIISKFLKYEIEGAGVKGFEVLLLEKEALEAYLKFEKEKFKKVA